MPCGILPMPAHRSEFPPAIPRRVASQQSPLPLRRIRTWNQEPIPLVKVMLQASMPGRKNSPPPLDSTHISCRLAAPPDFGSPGPLPDSCIVAILSYSPTASARASAGSFGQPRFPKTLNQQLRVWLPTPSDPRGYGKGGIDLKHAGRCLKVTSEMGET